MHIGPTLSRLSRFIPVTIATVAIVLAMVSAAQAAAFERRDVTFVSQGLKCAAWYYLPGDLLPGDKRPAIVMAHGYSAVKESWLDNYADKFAAAGFVVLVFDYRFLGASEGEPRQQIFWQDQIKDYRNAITWVSMQPQVDPARIGVWGSSYSGGHVMHLAAFDKRVKAVVAQVPVTNVWEAYFARLPREAIEGIAGWHALARAERMTSGKVLTFPVVGPEGQPAVLPQPESYRWFMDMADRAPTWKNEVTVESLENGMDYDPTAFIHLIAPTPLLMVIASDDIVTPTDGERKAFERAREPKQLVVVPGGHFEAYHGPKHLQFFEPQLAWFQRYLAGKP